VKIEGREVVALPRDEAWRRLNDAAVLSRCTPGLESFEETEPGHFEAVLEIALPTVTGRFTGSVDYLERRAPEELRLTLSGKGPPGFVDGEVTLNLRVAGDAATEISYRADVQVGGQVARLGQRMLSGIAKEMTGQFFEAFAQADSSVASARSPLAAFLNLCWRTLKNLLGLSSRS
jgi:carbon monoxide dehydrogenase subunit G